MVIKRGSNAAVQVGERGQSAPCGWVGLVAVAVASTLSIVASVRAGGPEPKVVYGPDNRVEVGTLGGQRAVNANATVALVESSRVVGNGDGTSRLIAPALGRTFNLCPGQRFRAQPTAAFCSGFLARPDRVVTAGHCVTQAPLATIRFVFGYRMLSGTRARTTIANGDIYRGVQLVVGRSQGGEDFAVVRLDRRVAGRSPARVQASNAVPLNVPLYVIGHPSGLPAKFAAGAKVLGSASPFFFSANLDTFDGNSGSPVFNVKNDGVVGLLVRGAPDYRAQGNCNVVNTLSNAMGQEEATRISLVRPFLGPPARATAARRAAARQP